MRPLGVLGGGLGRCGCVVHGMRSCAAGYLVSVVPSLSSFVRPPRLRRPRAMPLLVMSPPLACRLLPLSPPAPACVPVSPRLSPPLLLRGLFHAQLRRYPHAYHVSFAPASRRAPSFVHVRHHLAPLFTPFRLVVAVNVDIFSLASLPRLVRSCCCDRRAHLHRCCAATVCVRLSLLRVPRVLGGPLPATPQQLL